MLTFDHSNETCETREERSDGSSTLSCATQLCNYEEVIRYFPHS